MLSISPGFSFLVELSKSFCDCRTLAKNLSNKNRYFLIKKLIMANKQNEKQGASSNRGFAAMDEQQQREIARKGGEAVSKNREHMAEIGKKGGVAVSANREHMSEIGQKGGESRRKAK